MTKLFLTMLILVLTFSSFSLTSSELSLQLRSAAFFPSNNRFQDVYGNTLADFQIESSVALTNSIELWGNFDWLTKRKGKNCCKSRVCVSNGSMGLKYFFPFHQKFRYYLGLGLVYGKIILHNKTCCEKENKSKYPFGVIAKSGIQYAFTDHLFGDLFLDYSYQPTHYHNTVDIGGFKLGLGLGLKF
jgi:outer membrane protein